MINYYFDIDNVKIDLELLNRVYDAVLKYIGVTDDFEVELTITDAKTIQKENKIARGVDSVTDVLSFPAANIVMPFDKTKYTEDINPETGRIMLGDIMLCQEKAIEQANEYGHSFNRECGFLTLHGLLHLFGFDHIEEEDRIKMRKAEEEILFLINLPRE